MHWWNIVGSLSASSLLLPVKHTMAGIMSVKANSMT